VEVVWTPTQDYVERANVTRLMRAHDIGTFRELQSRSVADTEWFWDAVVHDLGIEFETPYTEVLDLSRGPEWATWFTGGTVNLAHQCVDLWAERSPERVAVIWEGEDGEIRRVTYAELRELTDRLANALMTLSVRARDTVGIFMPMAIETVVAVMACSKLGAIWVPIFSGFGPEAVASRLADAGATLVLTANASLRKGSPVDMKGVVDQAVAQVDGVRHVVVWDRLPDHVTAMTPGRDRWWHEVVAGEASSLDTPMVDAEHPLFIGYTSGTTGSPKGVVHVHGGFLVKIAEEVAYQVDLHQGEVLHWVTDLGWIMGPWEIVGALALGSTVLLTEGAPTHPGPERLWSTVERHGVTTLGVSPTLIRALLPHGAEPVRAHDQSSLRILASTGEPWNPESYRWYADQAGGGRCPVINLSGGTEVGACFVSPHPVVPIEECSVGGPALGMDIDIWGPDGRPVPRGEVGELVCTQPWPSMTRGVWGDDERYLDTYWRRFPGVWVHGDWARTNGDGAWFLLGRSDDTLSVAGKRLGPAEVEGALGSHPAVVESAAVGVPDPVKGEAIWSFVVLKPGTDASAELERALRDQVGQRLGRSFAPSRVVVVDDLPKTRSAKIVRRAIRAVATGEDPGDLSTLENPSSLDAIRAKLEC
jgi:acetyl-CoA synthetase